MLQDTGIGSPAYFRSRFAETVAIRGAATKRSAAKQQMAVARVARRNVPILTCSAPRIETRATTAMGITMLDLRSVQLLPHPIVAEIHPDRYPRAAARRSHWY